MFSLIEEGRELCILKTDNMETKTVIVFTGNEDREYALECVRALNKHFNPDNVTRHNNRSTFRVFAQRGDTKPFLRRHFDNNMHMELPLGLILQTTPKDADLGNVLITIEPEQAGATTEKES